MPETGTATAVKKRPSYEFERVVLRARGAIMTERFVPQIVPVAAVAGLFASVSWLGMWDALPVPGRIAGVALFAAAMVAAPFVGRTKFPYASKRDAIMRIDGIANDPQRPAETLSGKVGKNSDPVTKQLWEAHQERLRDQWSGKLKAGTPKPQVRGAYPAVAIAVLTAVTAFIANGQLESRINKAFDWQAPPPVVQPANVKAWVTPPDYTHLAPVYLTQPGQQAQEIATAAARLSIPEGSTLTLLSLDGATDVVRSGGDATPVPKLLHTTKGDTARYEIKISSKDNCISVKNGPNFCFTVIEDKAPTVSLDIVQPGKTGADPLELSCTANDDYGIELGDAQIEVIGIDDKDAKPLPNAKVPEAPLSGGPQGPCPVPAPKPK